MAQDILGKIRKLNVQANDSGTTEEEAQAFAAMVQRLLLKHKLSMTDVQLEEEEQEEIGKNWIDWEAAGVEKKKNRVSWMEDLSALVAKAYFCRILVATGSNRICLVGTQSNVEVAEYVITTLVRTAEKISWNKYNNKASHASRNKYKMEKGWRSSFLTGFIGRLRERLDEELNQEAPEGSTALVRVQDSLTRVDDAMNRMLGLGKASALRKKKNFSRKGFESGREAANNLNITGNRAVKGGSTRTTKGQLT